MAKLLPDGKDETVLSYMNPFFKDVKHTPTTECTQLRNVTNKEHCKAIGLEYLNKFRYCFLSQAFYLKVSHSFMACSYVHMYIMNLIVHTGIHLTLFIVCKT